MEQNRRSDSILVSWEKLMMGGVFHAMEHIYKQGPVKKITGGKRRKRRGSIKRRGYPRKWEIPENPDLPSLSTRKR